MGNSFSWAVPAELNIPADKLRCRLDFYHQAVTLTFFDQEVTETRVVSAVDVAHSLATELAYGTGLLPSNTLWWQNTKSGPIYALYSEPCIRKVALQDSVKEKPRRFTIPLPGLVFLCSPGKDPWVFAVKKKPTKESDKVYKAPLCNVFANGKTCPGNHNYPSRVADIIESFFISFFSPTANLSNRSKRFPQSVVTLWEYLDNKTTFPKDDLIEHGTVKDLMTYE